MTIVAAWIRAETGVGPSMASSSHDCNGTCADLPHAASSSRKPSSVAVATSARGMPALTSEKAVLPNSDSIVKMAIDIPRSPTRLTTNALRPAAAAEGLCCQKEISR